RRHDSSLVRLASRLEPSPASAHATTTNMSAMAPPTSSCSSTSIGRGGMPRSRWDRQLQPGVGDTVQAFDDLLVRVAQNLGVMDHNDINLAALGVVAQPE